MSTWVHEIQYQTRGFPGAPGFTNLYFEMDSVLADVSPHFHDVKLFLDDMGGNEPTLWSGQINPTGRILLADTGTMVAFSTCPSVDQGLVPGTSGGSYSAGVAGVVFGWQTVTVRNGRVVRGRTFLVPVTANTFEADGTITGGVLADLNTEGKKLITAGHGFCVYSRPKAGVGGLTAAVTSLKITDQAAFLSSRRA